jgi:threonine dehydratase
MAVEEVCVIKGMQLLYERFRLIVVPAAAFGVACNLENCARFEGRNIVTVLCGRQCCTIWL